MPGRCDTVTFSSDYGLGDPFVGVCHAVIARIAPHARVIDLTHGIPRQDVAAGAATLGDCAPFLPPGVHLAVVDPGVGTERRPVVVAAGEHLLVGPDNGLLLPAADRLGGIGGAWTLAAPAYRLEPVSSTFHGRDIFAPAAAHLATGVDPAQMGPALHPRELVRVEVPVPRSGEGWLDAAVLSVDGFGNAALNAGVDDLTAAGLAAGDRVVVRAGGEAADARVVTAFADVPGDQVAVLVDSFGRVALVVNQGDAARAFGLTSGTAVRVARR